MTRVGVRCQACGRAALAAEPGKYGYCPCGKTFVVIHKHGYTCGGPGRPPVFDPEGPDA